MNEEMFLEMSGEISSRFSVRAVELDVVLTLLLYFDVSHVSTFSVAMVTFDAT